MAEKTPYQRRDFSSTRRSLIFAAVDGTPVTRREALDELWRLYLPALRSYLLLRLRIEPQRAEDLLQAFATRQILERKLLTKFDATRGRFRSFLLKSLQNFVFDQRKSERVDVHDDLGEPETKNISDTFELEWSRQLLGEALRRMRRTCIAEDKAERWELFRVRVAVPTLTGCSEPSYKSLVERFGFRSPEHACNALVTAKRQFERILRSLVAETENASNPAEIDAEIDELCAIARRAGPLDASWARDLLGSPGNREPADSQSGDDSGAGGELATLLSIRPNREGNWRSRDRGDLLRHCLDMQVDDYLQMGKLPDSPDEFSADSPSQRTKMAMPLGDFLQGPMPPLGLLITLKLHSRRMFGPTSSDIPAEVHGVIYLASIAAARLCHSERISKLDDNVLRRSFDGLATHPHIDVALRKLFETALRDVLAVADSD